MTLPPLPQENWGEFPFSIGATKSWKMNALNLEITRLNQEWQICWSHTIESSHNGMWLRQAERTCTPPRVQRHLFANTCEHLTLKPCLPDRSIVIRPTQPSTVHPEEQVTFFIGLPMWLTLVSNGQLLQELPTAALSHTWFGKNTRLGELCYLIRTRGRTQASPQQQEPLRIIVPVTIHNMANTPLSFDRFCLPIPMVSLYQGKEGMLITQQIRLQRHADDHMAEIDIVAGAPPQCSDTKEIAQPRCKADKNILFSAFSSLFSGGS